MIEVTEKTERIIRHTVRQEGPLRAAKKLREITGCSIRDSKQWVIDCNEEHIASSSGCPYCGCRLRSPEAKQCKWCMRDWHDEATVLFLGTDRPWKEEYYFGIE